MQSDKEELRRKHIETLEVLQRFAEENEALKAQLRDLQGGAHGGLAAEVLRLTAALDAAGEADAELRAAHDASLKKARATEAALKGEQTRHTAAAAELAECYERQARAAADSSAKTAGNARVLAENRAAAAAAKAAQERAELGDRLAEAERLAEKGRLVASEQAQLSQRLREAEAARSAVEADKVSLQERIGSMTKTHFDIAKRLAASERSAPRSDAASQTALVPQPPETPREPRPPPAGVPTSVEALLAAMQLDRDDALSGRDSALADVDLLRKRLENLEASKVTAVAPASADGFADHVLLKREVHRLKQQLEDLSKAHVRLQDAAQGGNRKKGAVGAPLLAPGGVRRR